MADYTGPLQPTAEQWEKWYHRAKDMLNPIQQRGQGIAINKREVGLIRDTLARLKEDETWPHDGVPDVIVSQMVKPGDIWPFDHKTRQIVTMRQLLQADTGFARFGGLVTPSGMDGLHNPWRRNDHG